MATEKECAALSAFVCDAHRVHNTGLRGIPLPAGWSELNESASGPDTPGFRVNAFANPLGDMVLAFTGPDFIAEAHAASDDADELVTNLALDIGLATYTDALQSATQVYGLLRQRARKEGWDTGRIHFTGHGVGGGIASVMAGWFDQACTVFAQAPLRAVALTPGDFARALRTLENLLDSADGAVKALHGFIRHPQETLAQREQLRVTHWHVRGEVYSPLRSPATAIQGTEHVMDIGIQPPTMDTALTLHTMKLHAALRYDPRLSLLCQESPDLLSLLMDRDEGCDLIDTLISDQHRVGLDAQSALQRFVTGLEWSGEASEAIKVQDATAG